VKAAKGQHYFVYHCPCWPKVSGEALVTYNGAVVGMHLEGVTAAREILEHKVEVDDRLEVVELSLKSLVYSTSQGSGLLASVFPLKRV